MTCTEYREKHPGETPETREHVSACAECRAFAETWTLLREYPEIAPRGEFLRGIRRKLSGRILRFAAKTAVAAAAAAVLLTAVVFFGSSTPAESVTEEERELVENLELLEDYELLTMLEWVSDNGTPLLEENN